MYVIPADPKDAKDRYVELTDPAEIQAGRECKAMNAPIIVDGPDGKVYAELDSLRRFRGEEVEIEV